MNLAPRSSDNICNNTFFNSNDNTNQPAKSSQQQVTQNNQPSSSFPLISRANNTARNQVFLNGPSLNQNLANPNNQSELNPPGMNLRFQQLNNDTHNINQQRVIQGNPQCYNPNINNPSGLNCPANLPMSATNSMPFDKKKHT